MSKRAYGTGHLYEKCGAYYGRWRAFDGRRLNRKIGPVRAPGGTDGLTRTQAEREFRKMQEREELRPRPPLASRSMTVDDVATSLRERLELRGVSKSYRETCEYMQRIHVGPLIGERNASEVTRDDNEAFARTLLKRDLAPKFERVEKRRGLVHNTACRANFLALDRLERHIPCDTRTPFVASGPVWLPALATTSPAAATAVETELRRHAARVAHSGRALTIGEFMNLFSFTWPRLDVLAGSCAQVEAGGLQQPYSRSRPGARSPSALSR
jgi:hypothetical protein